MEEANEFEKEKERIKSLFNFAKKYFIELIKVIDNDDKEETERFEIKLQGIKKDVESLKRKNTNKLLNGKYQYVIDVINNFFKAANVVKKVEAMEFSDIHLTQADETWYCVYRRYFEKKYNGPAVFIDEIDRWDEILEKRKKALDINNMIKELINITTKKLTKIDELPDYYDMYQVTDSIKLDDYIDCESIANLIYTCSIINEEDKELINTYFKPHMIGKDFNITIDENPLSIKITCSDGRRIKIVRQVGSREESYMDDWGTYTIYITNIILYFPINQRKDMKCIGSIEKEYHYKYIDDYIKILKNINSVESPKGKELDWKYFVLHKNNYITNEEIKFLSEELYSFNKGITDKSPRVRINTLKKVLK